MHLGFHLPFLFIFFTSNYRIICEILSPDLSSIIPEMDVRNLVQDFARLCEGTQLCNVNVSLPDIEMTDAGRTGPCCCECRCDSDCHKTDDCCPDIIPSVLNSEQIREKYDSLTECKQVQFPPALLNASYVQSYEMVSKCLSSYYNKALKEKCEQNDKYFSNAIHDITETIPVTDDITKITYKNRYCAICNEISNETTVLWQTDVQCNDDTPFLTDSRENLITSIKEESTRCVLSHIPPDRSRAALKQCTYVIDRCNVTGLYTADIPSLRAACSSYTSVYKNYKNIHCYLCNGNSEDFVEDKCLLIGFATNAGFTGTLNLNGSLLPSNDKDGICDSRSKFDRYSETCLSLFCSEMMWHSGMHCVPYYKRTQPTSYEIRFRLVPRIELSQMDTFNEIRDKIREKLLSETTGILCKFDMQVTVNSTEEQFQDFITQRRFPALQIDVVAVMYYNQTVSLVEQELNELLNVYTVNFTDSDNFTLLYIVDEKSINKSVSAEEEFQIFRFYMFGSSLDDLHLKYFIKKDNLVSLILTPLPARCGRPIRVNYLQWCAKIVLSNDSFTVDVNAENAVKILVLGEVLETAEVMFTDDKKKMIMCAERYFQLVEKKMGNQTSQSNKLNGLGNIVLSFILLIFLFSNIIDEQ